MVALLAKLHEWLEAHAHVIAGFAHTATTATVVLAVVWWFYPGAHERHDLAVNTAWQAINSAGSAGGQAGSGGRIEALETLNREHVSLGGLAVPGAYLERIGLAEADLDASVFDGARLTGAVFHKAHLRYAVFNDARLQNAEFQGSKARYASFFRAFLNDADFTFSPDANCPAAPATPSPTSSASPSPSPSLRSPPTPATIANAGPDDYDSQWRAASNLSGANEYVFDVGVVHDGTNLYNASFDEASLHRAKFCGAYLYQAKFDGVDAIGANFNGAAARYASFRGAVLEAVDFRNADLADADFTDACLLAADFEGAKLGGATFEGARLGFDPNEHVTNLEGAQIDERFEPFAGEIRKLRTDQFRNTIVAYDVKGGSLLARKFKPEGRERPPSCPPASDLVPIPVANYGEHD